MKKGDQLLLIISVVVFGLLAIAGLVTVALFRGGDSETGPGFVEIDELVIWGTLPEDQVVLPLSSAEIPNFVLASNAIKYERMTLDQFRTRFVEELASGGGPDLVVVPHEHILEQYRANRILAIPYTAFPRANYERTFVDAASVFLDQEGVVAVPVFADPMVLYYNKTLATNKLVRTFPRRWSELLPLTRTVEKDSNNTVSTALVPLGAVDNYDHTKELVSLLQYQSARSDPATDYNLYNAGFGDIVKTSNPSGGFYSDSALSFYKSFSDPFNSAYTWNESLLNARNIFANGNLLFYPGFVSERHTISRLNANLRFGILPMLYEDGENASASTFVRIYAFALPKTTRYPDFLLQAIGNASVYQDEWFFNNGLPPTLREPLQPEPDQDATERTILDAVFTGVTWRDSAPRQTEALYRDALRRLVLSAQEPGSVTEFISQRLEDVR